MTLGCVLASIYLRHDALESGYACLCYATASATMCYVCGLNSIADDIETAPEDHAAVVDQTVYRKAYRLRIVMPTKGITMICTNLRATTPV